MILRLANKADIMQLSELKWQALCEQNDELQEEEMTAFHQQYGSFLLRICNEGNWKIWVAEQGEQITAHIYAQCITDGEANYVQLSDVYTSQQGVLQTLLAAVHGWLESHGYKHTVVADIQMSALED